MTPDTITNNMDVFAENFTGVNLHGQKIIKAEFDDCTFVSCDFSQTFFSSCRFIGCRFENCNLSLMKLTDTKMNAVQFSSCKMIGIDWTMANWESLLTIEPLHFRDCLLGDSNFFGLTLHGVVMSECRITEADFRSENLKSLIFVALILKAHSLAIPTSNTPILLTHKTR